MSNFKVEVVAFEAGKVRIELSSEQLAPAAWEAFEQRCAASGQTPVEMMNWLISDMGRDDPLEIIEDHLCEDVTPAYLVSEATRARSLDGRSLMLPHFDDVGEVPEAAVKRVADYLTKNGVPPPAVETAVRLYEKAFAAASKMDGANTRALVLAADSALAQHMRELEERYLKVLRRHGA
jgi:hypothetical protein